VSTADCEDIARSSDVQGRARPDALDVATVGDEQPVAVADRTGIQDASGQADPRAAITQTIDCTVELFERAGDLIMVTVQAADADPDMRAAADAGSRATRQLWRTLTQSLHDAAALRPGLTAHPPTATTALPLEHPALSPLADQRRHPATTCRRGARSTGRPVSGIHTVTPSAVRFTSVTSSAPERSPVASIKDIVFDSPHPASAARFWAQAPHDYEIAPYDEEEDGLTTWYNA
jgi:hypothetical protein